MSPVGKKPAVAPVHLPVEGVNFGSLGMYVAGGGLPEGDYALEFECQMFQAKKQDGSTAGPIRLGVMVTAHSLTEAAAEPRSQFYSMGGNADKSFAPNPDTGKGLVVVPGSAGSTLNNSSNWAYLLKSLYDCGMPEGVFVNDLTAIDGVWVHVSSIPEPEERKGFQSQTGEVAEVRKAGTISIVTEIKEGGCPWEGGGGFEAAPAPTPAAPVKPKGVVKPLAKPPVAKPALVKPKPAPPEPVAAAEAVDEDEVATAAVSGVSTVLESAPTGCKKLKLRTGTFKAVTDESGAAMAQTVMETYFTSDENIDVLIGPLGYAVKGVDIVVAG